MRIPSLSKIPKYRHFSYTPRFYDPVKEDLKNRTERIKAQIRNKDHGNYRSNMSYGFSKRSRENNLSNFRQVAIIVLLLATFLGYYYYENIVFYILLALVTVYLFYRMIRNIRGKRV